MEFRSLETLFANMSKHEIVNEVKEIKNEIFRLNQCIQNNVPCLFDMDWKGQLQIQKQYLDYANKLLKNLK